MQVRLHCYRCGTEFGRKKSQYLKIVKHFCSRRCYWDHRAEYGSPEISKAHKLTCEQCNSPYIVHRIRDRTQRRFCSVKCRAMWQASLPYPEWRGKLSANRANRPCGAQNPRFGKPPLHPGKAIPYVTRSGETILLRSSWEVEVARYLDRHQILWEYEPKRFVLGDTKYRPDFFLTEQQCFWEVKGWFHEKAKAKIAAFREMYPEHAVVVITKHIFAVIANDNRKHRNSAAG